MPFGGRGDGAVYVGEAGGELWADGGRESDGKEEAEEGKFQRKTDHL